VRIAIVNDSALAVEAMWRTIKASDRHEVAWPVPPILKHSVEAAKGQCRCEVQGV